MKQIPILIFLFSALFLTACVDNEEVLQDESFKSTEVTTVEEPLNQSESTSEFEQIKDEILNKDLSSTDDTYVFIPYFNACLDIYEQGFQTLSEEKIRNHQFDALNENLDTLNEAIMCYSNEVPYYTTMDDFMDVIMSYQDAQSTIIDYVSWGTRIQENIQNGEDYSREYELFVEAYEEMPNKWLTFLNMYADYMK